MTTVSSPTTNVTAGPTSSQPPEQTTVVLTTDERTWLLRRAGGPAFGVDEDLARYDGKTVEVTGEVGPGVFLVTEEPQVLT